MKYQITFEVDVDDEKKSNPTVKLISMNELNEHDSEELSDYEKDIIHLLNNPEEFPLPPTIEIDTRKL